MRSHCLSWSLSVCVALAFVLPVAPAQGVPDKQLILYELHTQPTVPESDVAFGVYVYLQAYEVGETWVKWEVTELVLVDYVKGQYDRSWSIVAPYVDTVDGLWQVEHADPENPSADEFVLPPLVYDQAAANDPADPDLNFSFEGVPYTPPGGVAPYPTTAALDHEFTCLGAGDPFESGWGEPVYVPSDPPDPPMG